jgi:hypothetical protein
MNTPGLAPDLLTWIDFKWLMAAEGHRVHLERLQADHDYALRCLRMGTASRSGTLRACASRLLQAIGG